MAFRIGKQGNPFGRKPKASSDGGVKRRAARRAAESQKQQKRGK